MELNDLKEFVILRGNKNADLNFKVTKTGMSPLLIVAAKGETDMLGLMLQHHALDVNMPDNFGVNAFWVAAFHGQIDAMHLLRWRDVEMSSTNQNGSTALHMAVKK